MERGRSASSMPWPICQTSRQRAECCMYFRYLSVLVLLALQAASAAPRVLRVCADPNNLPFSNQAGEGFENQLAGIIAAELHAELKYTWWAEHRSFLKNSLNAGLCDVV